MFGLRGFIIIFMFFITFCFRYWEDKMEVRRKLAGERATNIFETLSKLDDDTYKEAIKKALDKGQSLYHY